MNGAGVLAVAANQDQSGGQSLLLRGALKMQDKTLQDRTMKDKLAGPDIVGQDNDGQTGRA